MYPSMNAGSASGPPRADITPPNPTAPERTHPVMRLVMEDSATAGNL